LPAQVVLDRQLGAGDAAISGDPTMVYEAVMNLCTNGMQAMPQGGTLRVELDIEELPVAKPLFETTLRAGRYVRLAVSDTGSGIAPEVMSRLFEPFFTTKGPHKGTGLGLAVVHGVVADLGGAVDVHSEPGKGSRFDLYFPCADRPPGSAERLDGDALDVPMGHGQSILVVDDEPGLVELAEELLAGLGYEAFGVASSVQALARFRENPSRFELVLTDEVMPEMTGTVLATELHALRPDLPIVLASGYGGPQLEQRAAAAGVTVLVKKPLARAELARAVARALTSGRA
jgi:CheY-like chemotaxis protein